MALQGLVRPHAAIVAAPGAIAGVGFPRSSIATTNRRAAQEMAVAEVKCIAPTRIGGTDIEYAQGMRAGSWLFFTGHMAIDFAHGLAAQVTGKPGHPLGSPPRYRREGDFIVERLAKLTGGGQRSSPHRARRSVLPERASGECLSTRTKGGAQGLRASQHVRAHGRAIGRWRHHGGVHDYRPARRRP